ncbi:hypothetical protein JB92DRAFT_774900 [Gautieria morchelliformis]|nr:hypothetical protein JB92DRAFT_774900 [Gautieria morchelliformis]
MLSPNAHTGQGWSRASREDIGSSLSAPFCVVTYVLYYLVRGTTGPGGDAAAAGAAAAEPGRNDQVGHAFPHSAHINNCNRQYTSVCSRGWLETHSPAYSQATSGLRLRVDVRISFRLRKLVE